MKWKKLLIGCLIVSGVCVILFILGGFFLYRNSIAPIVSQMMMPTDLKTPSILKGAEFISKNLFFEDSRLGNITDIVIGELNHQPGIEIGIAGSNGALFVDKSCNVKASVNFNTITSHIDIIDLEGDGICEFMVRGSWLSNPSLINHKGDTIWTYGDEMSCINDMASGDIDGDGNLEFVAGFNASDGVHLIDKNGKKKWDKSDKNVWHVEFVDTNGDGKLEIVHSNAAGQITVRDRQGNIINRTQPPTYFSLFSLCRYPNKKSHEYALVARDDIIWIFDFDGKTIAKLNAPKCGILGHARGLPVKIKSNEAEYLAVIVDIHNWNRSILYVYSPAGTLVYQEILLDRYQSIASISLDKSGVETILIGGKEKILQYKAKN